jgi:hypothetical protein
MWMSIIQITLVLFVQHQSTHEHVPKTPRFIRERGYDPCVKPKDSEGAWWLFPGVSLEQGLMGLGASQQVITPLLPLAR